MGRLPIKLVAFLGLLGAGSGCTVGRNFERPENRDLVLGKTTMADVLEKYGSPKEELDRIVKGRRVKTLKYYYLNQAGRGHRPQAVPDRSLAVDFADDRLVGYLFHSSFDQDHTDFDDTKVELIKKGETSAEAVLQWLGEPNGRISPALREIDGETVLVYGYFEKQKTGNLILLAAMKVLTVTCGKDGIVTDVKFNKRESK